MTINRAAELGDFTGRTLEGVAYRYDRPSRVTDDGWASSYYEEMRQRCDTKTLKDRAAWPVDRQHDRNPLGEVTFAHSDDEKALMFTALIDRSPRGDQLLAEIESWQDVSVSFDALRSTKRTTEHHGTIVQRAEIRLNSMALAASGTGLASGNGILTLRAVTTPRLTAVRRRLILL